MPIARIDKDLCTGCGMCVDTCPEDVIRLNTQPFDKELMSPCAKGCPAGVSVRKYSYLVELGAYDEAIEVLREYLPFPAITGRICPHPCESKCARADVDEAVNINSLERFVADLYLKEKAEPVKRIYLKKAAVVGSGPAGLSCAYFLCRKGYAVTVFESQPVIGGTMRTGIPAFRLPREIVEIEVNRMRDMGVEFRPGVSVGKDISVEELKKEYDAIFFAIGLQLSRKVSVEGDDIEEIMGGLEFLRDVALGNKVEVRENLVVIGGGNVAIDVAMTARRLGAKNVTLVCLESRDTMPAFEDEIRQASEEGISIKASSATKRIIGENGRITGIEIMPCVSVFDATGAFNPQYDETKTEYFDTDQIIFAIGQASDMSCVPADVNKTRSTITADPVTLETNIAGIFAGGDIVPGQGASVVNAAASGKRAAESIDRYLRGVDLRANRDDHIRAMHVPTKVPYIKRQEVTCVSPEERVNSMEEYKPTFTENMARVEAMRCMTCGSKASIEYPEDCMVCLYCERDCPSQAIYVSPDRLARRIAPWDLA